MDGIVNHVLCLQTDLVSTIGESVALGAAGVIFWGDSTYTKSRVGVLTLTAICSRKATSPPMSSLLLCIHYLPICQIKFCFVWMFLMYLLCILLFEIGRAHV